MTVNPKEEAKSFSIGHIRDSPKSKTKKKENRINDGSSTKREEPSLNDDVPKEKETGSPLTIKQIFKSYELDSPEPIKESEYKNTDENQQDGEKSIFMNEDLR